MNTPIISIIIPIYNAGSQITRCIESIFEQSFNDFELLLIDDGSQDESGVICDNYAIVDNRIRVFHKENGGVSSARNLGLDKAKGNWICFIDADDYIVEDFCTKEELFSFDSCDIIIFPTSKCPNAHGRKSGDIIHLEEYLGQVELKTLWGKLYNKSTISKLRFDEKVKVGEDELFLLTLLVQKPSVRYIDRQFYSYCEPQEHFYIKYSQTVEQSIYALESIFSAYSNLMVKSPEFEQDLFFDYKMLCQKAINKNPETWYHDPRVEQIYSRIKDHLGIIYRIKYFLLSIRWISRINSLVK